MATLSDTTTRPAPEIPPSLGDLDQLLTDLRTKAGAAYFALIGASEFYQHSTANPGDFDGLLDLARDAWSLALTAEQAVEAMVGAKEDHDADDVAHGLWQNWCRAAAQAARQGIARADMPDDPDSKAKPLHAAALAAADALCDRLYNIRDDAEAGLHGLGGTAPVAIAGRLHAILYRTGGAPEGEEDATQLALRDILADLKPHLPADMAAAIDRPYSVGDSQ